MKKTYNILKLIIVVMIGLCSSYSYSQKANRIDFKAQGVSLSIPEGWVGQETVGGYAFASNTVSGFILVTTNNYTNLAMMTQQARLGIANGATNNMQLVNDIDSYNTIVIGGEYQGVIEGYAAKAYIINVANETGGSGVSIMASTNTNQYSNFYKQLCINIANTVELYPPIQNLNNQTKSNRSKNEMEELFGGARLSYFNSGDGYGTKITIDLCEQGFFHHSSYDSIAATQGDISIGSGDNSSGAGIWSIIENPSQNPILRLSFHNGKILEYYITFDGKKTYLDNRRYFRVYGEDGARWCN